MQTEDLLGQQAARRDNENIKVLRDPFCIWRSVRKPAHGLFLERFGLMSLSGEAAPALPAPRDAPKHATAITAHPRPRREDLGHLDRIVVLLAPPHFVTAACGWAQAEKSHKQLLSSKTKCSGCTGAMTTCGRWVHLYTFRLFCSETRAFEILRRTRRRRYPVDGGERKDSPSWSGSYSWGSGNIHRTKFRAEVGNRETGQTTSPRPIKVPYLQSWTCFIPHLRRLQDPVFLRF